MRANYINIDGVTGLHVEFNNGFTMDIPVNFNEYGCLHTVLEQLYWYDKHMAKEWDMGISLANNCLNATYRPVEYRSNSILCIDLEDETPYAVYTDINGYPRLAPFELHKFFLSEGYFVVAEDWSMVLASITMSKLPDEVPDVPWGEIFDKSDETIFNDEKESFLATEEGIYDEYLADVYEELY